MKTILVIEDNASVREEICDILKIENFKVLESSNGKEAIKVINVQSPDLIILDIMMPILNGYDLLKIIKQNPETDMIPVILLSAKTDKKDIREGMNLGADDYLTKPVNASELINVINNKLTKQLKIERKFEDLREGLLDTLPHEFRTPLNSIMGFADILRTKAEIIPPEKIKKYANIIYESGLTLHRLNENYLLFSRLKLINTSQKKLNKIRKIKNYNTNTVEVIKSVLQKFKHKYSIEKKIELKLDECIIQIDEFYFEKLVYELTDNSLKFSDENSVIKINSSKENDKYQFSIENNGRTMTNEQIANIGAFVQFDRNKHAQSGLGLGLAIVKQIIFIYNGTFKIENNKENLKVNISFLDKSE